MELCAGERKLLGPPSDMKLCYVDETGTDGKSPVVVMVGIIADSQRLRRTQVEFESAFETLTSLPERAISELKSTKLYRGTGPWHGVPGVQRHKAIEDLCTWVCDRKHDLALVAIDTKQYEKSPLDADLDIWLTAALHIALQIQRAHQSLKKNEGNTFLVFDEHKLAAGPLASLLYEPPSWTDEYYSRSKRQGQLDQIIDTAFYARSHHVGLVQVADLFAFIFRRHAELRDYGSHEEFDGEADRIAGWAAMLAKRLVSSPHRWPKKPMNACARWYRDAAPPSLVELG